MECASKKLYQMSAFSQANGRDMFAFRFQVLRATPEQELQFVTGELTMKRFSVIVFGLLPHFT
jgi:hypothetical protein